MIYLTGDTHGTINEGKLFKTPHIKADDYLIIAGDFGYIWYQDRNEPEELKALERLSHLPYTLLFIDGNHENFDRLLSDEFETVERFGGPVKRVRDNIFYLMRAEEYLIENKRIFALGGAMSTDKEFRTPRLSWWEDEIPDSKTLKRAEALIKSRKHFDMVLTHAAPQQTVDKLYSEGLLLSRQRKYDPLSVFLESMLSYISFDYWFCGHYHLDMTYPLSDSRKIQLLYNDIIQTPVEKV